jgi:hypothetical protein
VKYLSCAFLFSGLLSVIGIIDHMQKNLGKIAVFEESRQLLFFTSTATIFPRAEQRSSAR